MFTKNELKIILDYAYYFKKYTGKSLRICGEIDENNILINLFLIEMNMTLTLGKDYIRLVGVEEDRKYSIIIRHFKTDNSTLNIDDLRNIIKYFSIGNFVKTFSTYKNISISVVENFCVGGRIKNKTNALAQFFYRKENYKFIYFYIHILSDANNSMFNTLCHEFGHYLINNNPNILKNFYINFDIDYSNRWENTADEKEERFCELLGFYMTHKYNIETKNIEVINELKRLNLNWKKQLNMFHNFLENNKLSDNIQDFFIHTSSKFNLEYKPTLFQKIKKYLDNDIKVCYSQLFGCYF